MPRVLRTILLISFLLPTATFALPGSANAQTTEQIQVAPPMRRIEPPPADWSAERLEERGDLLRTRKAFLDSLDYYSAALSKDAKSAILLNKIGITNLQLQRLKDADKYFHRAIKYDKQYADAYNNLGVIEYLRKKYGRAVKRYESALKLRPESASFYSNLGAAYFSKKEFEKAIVAYNHAVQLDPEILERTSASGVTAQMSSPEDRAHYDYVVAKMYAKLGIADRSLQYLRKAMEEGYKEINNVFKDAEFAALRKDNRFTELMASRPPAIPE